MILVDTNILLDLATKDSEWWGWSLDAIRAAAIEAPLFINAIVYAELSARYESASDADDFVEILGVQFLDIPRRGAVLPPRPSANIALREEPKQAFYRTSSLALTPPSLMFRS